MKIRIPIVLLVLALLSRSAFAQEPPRLNEVELPLREYLGLLEKAESVEREAARQAALRVAPVAEVVAQRTTVVVGEKEVEVAAELEVLIQGRPQGPVRLPWAGLAAEVTVVPAAAVTAGKGGGLLLVAPAAGRYTVKAAGRAPLENRGGVSRFAFAPALAAVATTEVDLPADLAWSAPGAVVVEDREAGGRRKVRLAVRRGEAQSLEVRRRVEGAQAETLYAQSIVTIIQLLPDGPRRHDVLLYDVVRGGLSSFTVELPPGLAVETVGTDEGDVVPVMEARRLTVHRRTQLTKRGYLVLTSTPEKGASLPLAGVTPEAEVQARYLALSSAVAADARPLPEASWSRVDLDDLPAVVREALSSLDLSAAWRLMGPPAGASAETALAVSMLAPAPSLASVIRLRETTTLLTLDGMVVHRERLTLDPSSGPGTAFELTLPTAAKLWSAQVDDQPVRPLERGGGGIAVPLGFGNGTKSVVEVVAVLERAIAPGRSELALELAQLAVPVLEHRWRLLLPEGNRYRFRAGDLRPARLAPAATEDVITVTGEATLRRKDAAEVWAVEGMEITDMEALGSDFDSFEEMKQGLVGGVKPLPVTIPETGKVLLLTGVLPPARVTVELEVKAKKKP